MSRDLLILNFLFAYLHVSNGALFIKYPCIFFPIDVLLILSIKYCIIRKAHISKYIGPVVVAGPPPQIHIIYMLVVTSVALRQFYDCWSKITLQYKGDGPLPNHTEYKKEQIVFLIHGMYCLW